VLGTNIGLLLRPGRFFIILGLIFIYVGIGQAGLPAEWRFQDPLPQGNHLRAAWAPRTNSLYVGGDGGAILHWDGSRWMTMATPTQKSVFGIHGLSETNIWAVGGDAYASSITNRSLILHYDGKQWKEVAPPNFSGYTYSFRAVRALSANNVWAVNDGGTYLAHWDGKAWKLEPPGTLSVEGSYYALTSVGTNHLYVAGTHGQLLHWHNNQWALEQKTETGSFSVNLLMTLWAVDEDVVYAGGSWGQVLRRERGGTWTDLELPGGLFGSDGGILHLWGTSATDVLLLGPRLIRKCDGTTNLVRYDYQQAIRAQWYNSAGVGDRLFCVGANGVVHEFLRHANGSVALSPLTAGGGAALHLTQPKATAFSSHGLLVGGLNRFAQAPSPLIYYDGTLAQPFPILPPGMAQRSSVNALLALHATNILVAWEDWDSGQGGVHRWNGQEWENADAIGSRSTRQWWISPGGAVYACYSTGVSRWNGAGSRTEAMAASTVPAGNALTTIWGRSEQDLFVGTDMGVVLHYTNSTWKSELASGSKIVAIEGTATETYAVGENGGAWRRDRTTWKQLSAVEARQGDDFTAMVRQGTNIFAAQRTPAGYVGGGLGRLWQFKGAVATPHIQGLSQPLEILVRTGNGNVIGLALDSFVITDQPAPSDLTLQRIDLTSTQWQSIGSTGVQIRPEKAGTNQPLVAAWTVPEPPALIPLQSDVLLPVANRQWMVLPEFTMWGGSLPPAWWRFAYDPPQLPPGLNPQEGQCWQFRRNQWLPSCTVVSTALALFETVQASSAALWTYGRAPAFESPRLYIERLDANNLKLSWPRSACGFVLVDSTNIQTPSFSWSVSSVLTATNQERWESVVPKLDPQKFYQLRR
jgi:hypothetical protein